MPENKFETRVRPHLEQVAMFSRQGMSENAIAKQLEISPTTFRKYKQQYIELANALGSRERANIEILNAFFKRACGYISEEEVKELKEIKEDDGTSRKEMITTKIVRKDVPPDLAAVKWWLENMGQSTAESEQGQAEINDVSQARELLQERARIMTQLAEGEDEYEQSAETMGD